ncbi:MAG: 30S ribosomal protein S1 [Thioalkalivibrionaceae bacterium]
MTENFADLLEESMAYTQMQPGAILTASVLSINDDVVIVNAGLKSEGVIPTIEFRNDNGELEIQVGDIVEVALETPEDGFGEARMSREKAKRAKAWDRLEQAMAEEQYVTGILSGKVKGGYTVELGEIRAFLPGSLVDVRPVRDTSYLEGKPLEFKLIKLDRRRNNVVVSRRAVVEQEYSAERDELIKSLQEGVVLKGIVKNLTDYGAFLDLGGIDGLLHITDMAWKRVKHPSEVVEVGQELDIKVLKFDRERMRVSLGLKQLGEDPWINIGRRYPTGTRVFGKVTNITDYGCFVEIEDGVEGLVHVSEMDWTNKNVNPAKVVTIGQEVEVMILDIDEDRRRISLGMKQCQSNPWDDFAANHNRGEKVRGQIKSITDFGVFVGLDGEIDGLIHMSDLSWSEPGEEAIRNFKKGDIVEAVVLSVDPERERISLGLKQLERDPFQTFVAENPQGSIVKGRVKEVDARAAVVELADGIDGILRAADISRDRVEDARTALKEGQEIEARFMGVDKRTRAISLSIKAKDAAVDAEMLAEFGSVTEAEEPADTTLGALLKEQLGNRRD